MRLGRALGAPLALSRHGRTAARLSLRPRTPRAFTCPKRRPTLGGEHAGRLGDDRQEVNRSVGRGLRALPAISSLRLCRRSGNGQKVRIVLSRPGRRVSVEPVELETSVN